MSPFHPSPLPPTATLPERYRPNMPLPGAVALSGASGPRPSRRGPTRPRGPGLLVAIATGLLGAQPSIAAAQPPTEPTAAPLAIEAGDGDPTGDDGAAAVGATTSITIDDADSLEAEQRAMEAGPLDDQQGMVVTSEADRTVEESTVEDGSDPLEHGGQVGVRIGAGVPYVFGIKYGEGARCSDDPGETFCRHFGASVLDLELGFGVTDGTEVSFSSRFGLTDDVAANTAPVTLGLGIRAYGSPDSIVKLFFGGRILLDVTSSDVPEWSSVDVGFRGEFGLQVDVARYVGIYAQLGETLAFLRSLYFISDVTGGIQIRFP